MAKKPEGPPLFVWLDLEMTGLDPARDVILDVAAIITGPDLVPKEQYAAIVWQPESALAGMDPFVREMHTKSRLLDRVRAADKGLRDVEKDLFCLIQRHAGPFEAVLAGNSIHADRGFVKAGMPLVDRYLSYRMLDVTTVKLLKRAWYGELEQPVKKGAHTALADIEESLAELAWYRDAIFRKKG
jgi:oligoribonuclease